MVVVILLCDLVQTISTTALYKQFIFIWIFTFHRETDVGGSHGDIGCCGRKIQADPTLRAREGERGRGGVDPGCIGRVWLPQGASGRDVTSFVQLLFRQFKKYCTIESFITSRSFTVRILAKDDGFITSFPSTNKAIAEDVSIVDSLGQLYLVEYLLHY